MSTFEYIPAGKDHPSYRVKMDRRLVGIIEIDSHGFRFRPKGTGKLVGDYFPTLALCKASIEGTDEE